MSQATRRASSPSLHSYRHHCLIIGVLILVILGAWTSASATIASTSGNVVYVDTSSNQSPKLIGNYVSYKVTNNTGSTIADAWVTIGSFTGAYLALAPNETGTAHLGAMAAGASRTVYFYLNVDCTSFSAGACNIATAQDFTVKLYSGPPSTTLIESQSFSATVVDAIAAQANKVTTVVTSSNNPLLGTLLTVTVSGNTGTIGSAKTFYASPESYYDFPASSFRLYSTSVTFSGGNTGTYTDQLLVPSSAFSSSSATDYSFVATYLVVGTTATSTAVSPVAYISSGTQIKHTDTSGYASFPPIGTTSNSLTLQKLVSSQTWPTGGIPTYTLRISNSGGSSATLDDLVDTLPAGVSYVAGSSTFLGSAIGDPTISSSTLTWTGIFNVPANGSADLTFQATVPNVAGTYTNSAIGHVSTTPIDTTLSTTDNSPATVWLSVGTSDLVVGKTHTGNFTQGQTGATYTLTVGNNGTGATSGTVTVTDTLPTGLTATAISGTGWSCTLATLTCTRSDVLASSGTYPAITLIVNVANNAAASLTNTATVSGGGEVNTANDSASDVTTVNQVADLTISKTHSGNFTQGQSGATYTITVSNSGPGSTSGTVTVADTLPTGMTATAISGTGWSCTLGTLTCTRSDVLAGSGSYSAITLAVNIASNAAASLTNTVTVSGGGELNTANDSASDVTTVTQLPDLTVTKTHSGNFTQSQTGAAYTITVSNNGTGATSGTVTVTDTLPSGLTATAISGTGWSCTLGTLTCTRSDVLAGSGSYSAITLTVTVASNAAASLTNTVTVSGGGEVNAANDSASDGTTVTQLPDLTITKTHTGNFTQGQTGATYTLTVGNSGAGSTTSTVIVTDTLPAGLTATAISGTGWTCTLGTVTCNRSDALASGSSYPAITLTVNVASNAAASLTNIATVSGGGEVNTANDSASDVTTVTQLPDLTITKTHSGNFTQGQAGATYAITVGNNGSGATSGTVTVTDTLPSGLAATAFSGTGWSCTLGTLTCTRTDALAGAGSYPAITLTVNVASNAAPSITNTATVSGGGEANAANDTANDLTIVAPPVQVATTTTLQVSPGSPVNAGTTVTLTANVLHGSTPVSPGEVNFCDASAPQCVGPALLGTAQLNASGNASIKFVPGVGTISIKAVFAGASPYLSSESAAQLLRVIGTGGYVTSTKISASGSVGNYTLTGTVTAFGKPVPTGTVSFLDASNGNAVVASAALDPLSLGFAMTPGSALPAVSGSPTFGATGDFNNDGKVDLAVPSGSGSSVSVLLGNGDGTFQAAQNDSTDTNGQALAIAVGDVNGDGNTDLVVSNVGSNTVSVLLGNGDGTFLPQVSHTVGNYPSALVVGDFNEDGNLDVAVANRDDGTVGILLGNGDGSFQAQSTYSAGNSPVALAAADLNGDGTVDLVFVNKNNNSVSVLLGNGDGTFQAPASYAVGTAPIGVVVVDFNGDGKIDIAASDSNDSTVSILLGNGDGTFQLQSTFVVSNAPGTLVAADLNGDGIADLVSSNNSTGAVNVLLGNGDGTFQAVLDFPIGTAPSGLAAGDFNGDGLTDVAAIDNVAPSAANILLSEHTIDATATGVSISGSGTHDVLASYPGDDSHQASQSPTVPLSGPAATATTTTLTASPNPAVLGQAVTFTATISPTPTGAPLGTVSFYNGTTLLGTVTVDASGVATFTTSSLPIGSNPISATYSGNTNFSGSTSSTLTETITSAAPTATATTIAASPNPATFGQTITLTATVSPSPTGTPTGTVSFYNGITLLGTATVDSSGVATLTTSSLPVGTNPILATYSGNAGFAGSTSSTLSETINKISTTTAVTASPNSATVGQPVTLSATISPTPTGSPTGTVSFYNGTALLGTATVNSSGVATLSVNDLAAGTANITAVYSGSTNYATSTSTAAALTVSTAAVYNVTAPQTPYTVKAGGAVNVNVSVPPVGGSYDNVVTMSASGLPPGAVATFNPPTVTPGSSGATTVMTIRTAAQVVSVPRNHRPGLPFIPMGIAAGICIMAGNRKRVAGSLVVLLILATLMCGALMMTGCGGGFSGVPIAQSHTYIITITGTSGSLHPSTTITLVVQ